MKKYSCEYPNGDILRIKDWKLKIEAESPRAAYDEFLSRVGIYEDRVIVSSGIFTHAEFDDHIETSRQRIN